MLSNNLWKSRIGKGRKSNKVPKHRGGSLLIETLVAIAVLTAALTLVGSIVALNAAFRRQSVQRSIALVQAANVLQRLSDLPYEELREPLTAEQMSAITDGLLSPDFSVLVDVLEQEQPVPSKLISVSVRPASDTQPQTEFATLTTWRFEDDTKIKGSQSQP